MRLLIRSIGCNINYLSVPECLTVVDEFKGARNIVRRDCGEIFLIIIPEGNFHERMISLFVLRIFLVSCYKR